MKILTGLFCLFVFSCTPNEKVNTIDNTAEVLVFSKGGQVTYRTVIIEGVEYFVSRTYQGNWVIGAKKENK